MREPSPRSHGPLLRSVHGGLMTGIGRRTRRAWRTAATEGGSSPRKHLEKEGTEGNLTEVGGGRHGNGARPATSFNGGGSTHPTRGD
jgi:hypothetical protein